MNQRPAYPPYAQPLLAYGPSPAYPQRQASAQPQARNWPQAQQPWPPRSTPRWVPPSLPMPMEQTLQLRGPVYPHLPQQLPQQPGQPHGMPMGLRGLGGLGGLGVGIPGMGGVTQSRRIETPGPNKRAGSMSPALVPVFFLAAIAVGFAFDAVFTFVHVPFGRYIWYATTFLPFALAGTLGASRTRAGTTPVMATAVIASLLYGAADIGLGMALGATSAGITLAYVLNLAAYSVGISLVAGAGGTIRGAKQRESVAAG
jgi:hypothetical protein